jgi:hypothetical protein
MREIGLTWKGIQWRGRRLVLKFRLTWQEGSGTEDEPPGWLLEIDGSEGGDLEGRTANLDLLMSDAEHGALRYAVEESSR